MHCRSSAPVVRIRLSLMLVCASVPTGCGTTEPSPLTRIVFPSCVLGTSVRFFAYRNEDSEWKSGNSSGFDATQRFEAAWATINGTYILRATVQDITTFTCTPPSPSAAHTVSVSGLQLNESARVFAPGSSALRQRTQTEPFTIQPNRSPFDVVAFADSVFTITRPRRVVVVRDLMPTTPNAIDLSPGASAMDSIRIELGNPPPSELQVMDFNFVTEGGTSAPLVPFITVLPASTSEVTVRTIPQSLLRAGDLYSFSYRLSAPISRSMTAWVAPGAPVTVSLGPAVGQLSTSVQTITVNESGTDRSVLIWDAEAPVDPAYGELAVVEYQWTSDRLFRRILAITTSGFRNGTGSWEMGVPDLSAFGAQLFPSGAGSRLWNLTTFNSGLKVYWGDWKPSPGLIHRLSSRSGFIP